MHLELCFAISFLEEENNYFLYLKYCATFYTGFFYSPILPCLLPECWAWEESTKVDTRQRSNHVHEMQGAL